MAGIITTASHPKALWPGVKELWKKEYGTEPFVAEYNKPYHHVKIVDVVDTYEEALEYVTILSDIIDSLAKVKRVYVRKKPELHEQKHFDTATTNYVVATRFSIDTSDSTEHGIIEAVKSYDDGEMLTGFGMAPIKKEG